MARRFFLYVIYDKMKLDTQRNRNFLTMISNGRQEENNMKVFFIMLVILSFTTVTYAVTPNIVSVSGTVATGQMLTITGTNMVQEGL